MLECCAGDGVGYSFPPTKFQTYIQTRLLTRRQNRLLARLAQSWYATSIGAATAIDE